MAQNLSYYWQGKEERAKIALQHSSEMHKNRADLILQTITNSKIYSEDSVFAPLTPIDSMSVELVDEDSVTALLNCAENNDPQSPITILNFASYKNPGGGFLQGSRAQEECLCHESYLYNVLEAFPDYYEWNNQHKNSALYTNRAIYSPKVGFERNKPELCYGTFCNVITCAAPNIAPSRKYGWGITNEQNTAALDSRIKFVLDIAAENHTDTLILGAFGCGVFGQNPREVADIFMKYLTTTHKVFKKVIFAIPKGTNPSNYMAFGAIINDYYKRKGV